MSDNFRREVRKLKRDAGALSGGVEECPFCGQPFISSGHRRASYQRDQERAAGARDALFAKLEEMARNRDEADLRAREREREQAEAVCLMRGLGGLDGGPGRLSAKAVRQARKG